MAENTDDDRDARRGGLSDRGWANVSAIMPKIRGAVQDRTSTTNTLIDLSSAENWLLRPELIKICKNAINEKLDVLDFSYPRAFAGFPDVLAAFVTFFNSYFHPHVPVETSHLATAPGAASCLDTLFYNICDPGDAILVAGPYWSGFDFQFQARSSVTPISVVTDDLASTLTDAFIPALEKALSGAERPVKALLMTNPSNPLAQCYPRSVIEGAIKFCQLHDLHYISDEVYALTSFHCPELPDPVPFVSALSIDLKSLGCEPSRVHTVWSPSKDLGQSGTRMGCSITQANEEMAVGLALASNTTTSSLSAVFLSSLLTSPELPDLLKLNSTRLAKAYSSLTGILKKHSIQFIPANAGLYLFAKIAPNAQSWEDESKEIQRFRDAGVTVSSGRGYHGPASEMGWARIGFAVEESTMVDALQKIDHMYSSTATEDGH